MAHVIKYVKFGNYHLEYMRKHYTTYLKKMNIPQRDPFSAMDIGCGDGKILNHILLSHLPDNCEEVMAADIDSDMLDYCKKSITNKIVKYQQMDVETEHLPPFLKNRFTAIFSYMCFMYVRNLRQALLNCNSMLKNDRDLLLLFFSQKLPLYLTYKEMSKLDIWKPYLQNFSNYVSHLSSSDPYSEAKTLLNETGFRLLNMENDVFEFRSKRRNFLEVQNSMDVVSRKIREDQQDLYTKDFVRLLSDIIEVNLEDESKLDDDASMFIPLVTLHARKL